MLLSMASFMWSEQVKWRGVAWCGVWCVIMLTFVLSSPDFMCHVKFFLCISCRMFVFMSASDCGIPFFTVHGIVHRSKKLEGYCAIAY